jgi:hypothetical protein
MKELTTLIALSACILSLCLAQEEETPAPKEQKTITLVLLPEEAVYITQLVGKQPTESGAFQLWTKLRASLDEQQSNLWKPK